MAFFTKEQFWYKSNAFLKTPHKAKLEFLKWLWASHVPAAATDYPILEFSLKKYADLYKYIIWWKKYGEEFVPCPCLANWLGKGG